MADVNTRKDAIALLASMAQNALGAFGAFSAAEIDSEKEYAAQYYRALDMAIADMKHLENDPGPFVRPDNLTDKEFLIVERNCVEVYSKDRFLPTPVTVGCVCVPADPWIRTTDQRPPLDKIVIACHMEGEARLQAFVYGSEVIVRPEEYPFWMLLPKPPSEERILQAKNQETK